ncbi:DNA methyltransferase [Nonomuraea sp. NPDC026600]|uniref:DNA methyltransferase n=1 Tax=Nonomuraea sp. NPDC026600 TaxID=3155363 RepID=UPI0033DDE10D
MRRGGMSDMQVLQPPEAPGDTSEPSEFSPASGIGRSHGTSGRAPFDRWFRYPAGFASDYAATLLGHLNVSPGQVVVDPFAGSGVTGTAAQQLGMRFFGIEAHPVIAELAALKLQSPPGDPAQLIEAGNNLASSVAKELKSKSQGATISLEPDLVQRSFSESTLGELLILRELIKSETQGAWSPYAKWALLGSLRDLAAVQVGWPYQRPGRRRKARYESVLARFQQRLSWIAEDLAMQREIDATSMVLAGDARDAKFWQKAPMEVSHGCVSSPPYLNNFDYADATRLELYFWGEATSWAEMVRTVRSDMITATTQQSSVPAARTASDMLASLGSTSSKISTIVEALTEERKARPRGKEYDRVIPEYFSAIAKVLENLASSLAPGACAAWLIGDSAPYGVYIDTPALIGEIAENFGLCQEKDITLRHRGNRWATNATRHKVLLSERLLLMRRCP